MSPLHSVFTVLSPTFPKAQILLMWAHRSPSVYCADFAKSIAVTPRGFDQKMLPKSTKAALKIFESICAKRVSLFEGPVEKRIRPNPKTDTEVKAFIEKEFGSGSTPLLENDAFIVYTTDLMPPEVSAGFAWEDHTEYDGKTLKHAYWGKELRNEVLEGLFIQAGRDLDETGLQYEEPDKSYKWGENPTKDSVNYIRFRGRIAVIKKRSFATCAYWLGPVRGMMLSSWLGKIFGAEYTASAKFLGSHTMPTCTQSEISLIVSGERTIRLKARAALERRKQGFLKSIADVARPGDREQAPPDYNFMFTTFEKEAEKGEESDLAGFRGIAAIVFQSAYCFLHADAIMGRYPIRTLAKKAQDEFNEAMRDSDLDPHNSEDIRKIRHRLQRQWERFVDRMWRLQFKRWYGSPLRDLKLRKLGEDYSIIYKGLDATTEYTSPLLSALCGPEAGRPPPQLSGLVAVVCNRLPFVSTLPSEDFADFPIFKAGQFGAELK